MSIPRQIYIRYFRGTPLGNAARELWYCGWKNVWRRKSSLWYARSASLWRRRGGQSPHWEWKHLVASAQDFSYRASYVRRYYWGRARPALRWLVESRESSNFTYDLTRRNEDYLSEMLSVVLARPSSEIAGYIRELHNDEDLKRSVTERVAELGDRSGIDATARFGRRIGWYALARALKPNVIVETGVEKGLGAVVLCAALLRNAQEGYPGRYYGTDIDRAAGVFLAEPYRSMGAILYGDSIESLMRLDANIDLFINDSDHSAEYEAREYITIASKLSEKAVIVGDNAHVTDELLRFSRSFNRRFLFFSEEPAEHWYLGAGIGLSFK
jgi:predicted O-methyltransferase YrrM